MPSFTMPHDVKPWKACSTDRSRPLICHGYLHRRDDELWLITTDSYVACAIKVEGDAAQGHIPRAVMRAVAKGHRDVEQLGEMSWRMSMLDGERRFDLGPVFGSSPKPFPVDGLAAYGLWNPLPSKPCEAIGLNPRLTQSLVAAMGVPSMRGVTMRFAGDEKAVRLTSQYCPGRIGLQMPVLLADA